MTRNTALDIRSYVEADRAAVVDLWQRCDLVVPRNDPNRDIDRKLAVGGELFLVGEHGGHIVASVMGGYEGHRGWMNYLAVAPEHRGAGFGRALVAGLEARLLAAGCPKLNLQVRVTNAAVIAFYESLGFSDDRVTSLGKRLIPDQ